MAFERTFYGRRANFGRITETGDAEQAKLGTVPADDPDLQAALLTRKPGQTVIGEDEVRRAQEILQEYKRGKANLERRIIEDELWYELRHWEAMRGKHPNLSAVQPTSAWLFNAIANKHADAMDNYPEPIALPREQSDEQSAQILSSVLPVIFEQNDFEKVYSDAWWEKLKHGTACYGVFWNPQKYNGLGDIDIKNIDLLNLFWEPGISDIQSSRNLFITALEDTEALEAQYPQLAGKLTKGTKTIDVAEYLYDDDVDTSKKSVVVDWYYKVRGADGRTVLHYCKFVGDTVLFASENDPEYAQRGWYDHGKYPVVPDTLFPEKGTPVGFGYIAICKDPQIYIDKLLGNILEKSLIDTKQRHFVSEGTKVNEDEFKDIKQPIVHVEGMLDDVHIREINNVPLNGIYLNVLQQRIEEMKDTAANRDANSGGAPGSGVVAASAIAALQEAGNKQSRDMIKSSYRSDVAISTFCVELMRQFYTEARSFRIVAPNAATGYEFTDIDNSALREQVVGQTVDGVELVRVPIFDIKIKAQKKNPFSRMEQNERAMTLYSAGFFNPEAAQQALGALEMMDFEGIDKVRERIQQGQTLMQIVQQQQAQIAQLTMALTGTMPPMGAEPSAQPAAGGSPDLASSGGMTGEIMESQRPKSGYTERIVKHSTPSVEG